MLIVAPALLVAALLSLVGAVVIGLLSALWAELRPATAGGTGALPDPRANASLASIAHAAVALCLALLVAALILRAVVTGHAP